jgi:hypothetical protein
MVCEVIGNGWVDALEAMAVDMRKAGIDPILDPKQMRGMIILAVDEILPARVKMTPRVGALIGTTVVIGQRYANHKKIVAAQKNDPDIAAYKRKQAEREASERTEAKPPIDITPAPAPEYAAPPPVDAPAPTINGTGSSMVVTRRSRPEDPGDLLV